MDRKTSELKLPHLRFAPRRSLETKHSQVQISLSPGLPRIQQSKKSYNPTRINSPDFSLLEIKPQLTQLPSSISNLGLIMRSIKESPIRPVCKKDSLHDQELENLIEGLKST